MFSIFLDLIIILRYYTQSFHLLSSFFFMVFSPLPLIFKYLQFLFFSRQILIISCYLILLKGIAYIFRFSFFSYLSSIFTQSNFFFYSFLSLSLLLNGLIFLLLFTFVFSSFLSLTFTQPSHQVFPLLN